MREIKFRAWLDYGNGEGEMLPNIQNHINGSWAFGHIVNGSVENVSAPMQYTGLKDEFGVDIYEGDIVSFLNDYDNSETGVVEFTECGRWIVKTKESYKMLYDVCALVIGNVYEI